MDENVKQPARYRSIMPCRSDNRVYNALGDHICGLYVRKRVSPTHVKEITLDINMFSMWNTIPHGMTSIMNHFVSSLKLIWRFRNCTQSMPPSQHDALYSTNHDSPPPSLLVE